MNKKKKITFLDVFSTIFPLLFGCALGLLWANFIDTEELFKDSIFPIFLLFPIFYLAFVLQIIIHEAGHLIFGLLTGYKFCSFRIYSLLWIKQDGKIKLKRNSIPGTAGQCLLSPPNIENMPFVLYTLGGVILNIVVSVLCAIIATVFPHNIYLNIFFETFTILGIGFALANGIPMKSGPVVNDGYNLACILKDRSALKSIWVQLKATEQLTLGVRLKDMPSEWFELPEDEKMKNALIATMGAYHCSFLMEQKDFSKTLEAIDHILGIDSSMIELHRELLICDKIYCLLIEGNEQKAAELMADKKRKKFMASMKQSLSVMRTQYAFSLICENNPAKALDFKIAFEKRAKSYPYAPDIESERELFELADAKFSQNHSNLHSTSNIQS